MNCEVFQEKINDFIFDRIEYSEDLEDFLSHAKECKDCMEELQLYYTIHRGLEDVPAPFEGEETKKAEEELQDLIEYYDEYLQRQKSYKKAANFNYCHFSNCSFHIFLCYSENYFILTNII